MRGDERGESPSDGGADSPAEAVRRQLGRILQDTRFGYSQQRREMLRFIVEEALAGRGDRLKGYVIATRVFGRSEDFDPGSDPVVRIEARRLRRDLAAYYMGPGLADPVLISIPKGRYLPAFALRDAAAEWDSENREAPASPAAAADAAPPRPARWRGAVAVTGFAGLLLGALQSDPAPAPVRPDSDVLRRPTVAVLPFRPSNGTEVARSLSDGIAHELVSNLMRFPDFRLFWARDLLDGPGRVEIDDALAEEVDYLVSGELAADDERIRLSAQLVDLGSSRVIWSETYERALTPRSVVALRADLAGEIATALGQPYGVVRNDIAARGSGHVPAELESYHCVLRAYDYRRQFLERLRAELIACLETAVRTDPRYAEAWAMLGWLRLDSGRFADSPDEETAGTYDHALAAASKALSLDAHNVEALKALSSIHHYRGAYAESEGLARAALERNPYDPDTLAQLGWRLAVRGNFDEGIPLLRRAIDRSIRPPGWYYDLIAIDHLMRGEHAEMLAALRRSARDGSAANEALIAIAQAHLGNAAAARTALDRSAEFWPRLTADPAGYFRKSGATEEIVAELMQGLRRAGWQPPGSELAAE